MLWIKSRLRRRDARGLAQAIAGVPNHPSPIIRSNRIESAPKPLLALPRDSPTEPNATLIR
jgi:hypothetical protein